MTPARYRIVRSIARGGMGEVFEAVAVGASGFERRVALKRLDGDDAADPQARERFFDEARIASKLHHTSIVAILDYGVLDDAPFQILELVDGMSAAALARVRAASGGAAGGALPPEVALYIAREIAGALQHAHDARDETGPLGVVHRDVKPGNVLLSWDGDVKLADFGIARAKDNRDRTATGDAKGTTGYMAPEQATATGTIDGRADVFSLGATLLTLAAGHNVLAGFTAQAALMMRDELEVPPEVAPDVAAIARRALRKDPGDRFATARAMAEALSDALAERGIADGRRALAELLAASRPQRPRPGALDALLAVDLLPGAGDPRTWVTRTDAPRPPLPTGPTASEERELETPPLAALPAEPPPRAKPAIGGRRTMAALAVLLAGTTTAAVALRRSGDAAAPRETSATAAASTAPSTAAPRSTDPSSTAPPTDDPTAPPRSGAEHLGASGSALPTTAAAAPPRPAGSARTAPTSSPTSPSAPTTSPTPEAPASVDAQRGYLAVGGEPTAHVRVRVDGADRGFAPTFVEVAPGTHSVDLAYPDGRTVRTSIVVGPAHTKRAPARVIPP